MKYCLRHPYWHEYYAPFGKYTKDHKKAHSFKTVEEAKAFAGRIDAPFTIDIIVIED